MREVVDARTAAAALRVGDIDDRHALDLLQKRAGLRADALAVREVAGILVRDPDGPRGAPRTWLQDLAEIADARREPLRPVGPGGAVQARRTRGGPAERPLQLRGGPDDAKPPGELGEPHQQHGPAGPGERVEAELAERARQRSRALPIAQHLARAFHDAAERHA